MLCPFVDLLGHSCSQRPQHLQFLRSDFECKSSSVAAQRGIQQSQWGWSGGKPAEERPGCLQQNGLCRDVTDLVQCITLIRNDCVDDGVPQVISGAYKKVVGPPGLGSPVVCGDVLAVQSHCQAGPCILQSGTMLVNDPSWGHQ